MLIPLLLLTLSSFSQNDTTKVQLTNRVARLVIKDLVTGDGCLEELVLTQEKINKLQIKSNTQEVAIKLLENKDENNKLIIRQQELQMNQYEHLTDDLQKELKTYKKSNFLWKIATMTGMFTSMVLLIK